MSSRVPGLSQSSIFHESDRLDAESIEKLNRRTGGGGAAPTLMEPVFKLVHNLFFWHCDIFPTDIFSDTFVRRPGGGSRRASLPGWVLENIDMNSQVSFD